MAGPPKRNTLTIYLLREHVENSADAVDVGNDVSKIRVTIGRKKCDLFIQPARPHPPRWLRFFDGDVDAKKNRLISSSSSAVLIVPAGGRHFALTFGHGRYLLATDVCEERFGLKTTLNAIEPDSVRGVQRQSFDALARQVQEQSAKTARALDFGFDVERDMLRGVTGTSKDKDFATRLAGTDALAANVGIGKKDLPAFLETCLEYYESDDYKEDYGWVDQIAPIKSKEAISDLDEELLKKLRKGSTNRLWMAVPEIIDWTRVEGFTFSASTPSGGDPVPDLHIRDFLQTVEDPTSLTIQDIRRAKSYCWASDQQPPLDKWSVYQCLYCEIDEGNSTSILSGGKWYRIERDYVATVNEYIADIDETVGLDLPDCEDISEQVYNERLSEARPDYFTLLDRKNVYHGGGSSQIEVCDLLTADMRLIHVKKYGGSSVLSHLFSQAAVSGELLFLDDDFRKKANKKLPAERQFSTPIVASDYEIVIAIISWTTKSLTLPFFSRVNLRAAHRRLRGFGYKVSLLKTRGLSAPKKPK